MKKTLSSAAWIAGAVISTVLSAVLGLYLSVLLTVVLHTAGGGQGMMGASIPTGWEWVPYIPLPVTPILGLLIYIWITEGVRRRIARVQQRTTG